MILADAPLQIESDGWFNILLLSKKKVLLCPEVRAISPCSIKPGTNVTSSIPSMAFESTPAKLCLSVPPSPEVNSSVMAESTSGIISTMYSRFPSKYTAFDSLISCRFAPKIPLVCSGEPFTTYPSKGGSVRPPVDPIVTDSSWSNKGQSLENRLPCNMRISPEKLVSPRFRCNK
jgi:hypothetical protein